MNTTTESSTTRSFLAVPLVGLAAGVLAGIAMLVTMGILRLAFGWPTLTELIFDRLFPFLTVEFFISSLVKAGGYTPLKLQGVYGALAGQVAVAAIGGNHFAQPFILRKIAELRGMAFRGDRGISKVEVSTDDGETWEAAEISQPGTKITWSLWRYEWTPKEVGESQLVVRATDGEGKLQISEYRDPVADGATGLHRVRANVVASSPLTLS